MRSVYILFIFLLILGCDSKAPKELFKESEKNNNSLTVNKKTLKNNKKISETNQLINNKNVKEKLFEFGLKNPEEYIIIKTSFGNIKIRLYDQTPLHRANFIMLAKKKFFDSTIFYRVIRNFMVQGGNSDKNNMLQKMSKIGIYRIPPEIDKDLIHKRGAIAMAVQEQYYKDPSKFNLSSSPYNFYIVQKGPLSNSYMDKIEKKYNIKIPKKSRLIYNKTGGTPHLDNEYTVFGEVVSGMRIVDEISKQITDGKNRPLENIYISIDVIK